MRRRTARVLLTALMGIGLISTVFAQGEDAGSGTKKGGKKPRQARAAKGRALMGELVKESMLIKFDKNQDGKLDETERAELKEKLSAEHRATMKELNEKFGKAPEQAPAGDEGGKKKKHGPAKKIGPEESLLVINDLVKTNHPDLLTKYDADKNGELSKDEQAAAAPDIAKAIKDRTVKMFDTNGDGKLDKDEHQAMRELLTPQRPAKQQGEKKQKGGGKRGGKKAKTAAPAEE